jgi:hypothetical protein
VVDFAVSKNTPESNPPRINSAAVILRLNDIGPDHRHQAIAELIRKIFEKQKAKLAIVAWWRWWRWNLFKHDLVDAFPEEQPAERSTSRRPQLLDCAPQDKPPI